MMYINADIIIIDDIMKVVEKVHQKFDTFLIVGQRIDLDIKEVIDFNSPDWKDNLLDFADEAGCYHSPTGIDYFIYSGDPWGEIPPFASGRTAWDGWLVYRALENGIPVIDATEEIRIIHQNHDYAHVAGGKSGAWTGEEARKNVSMAGGYEIARTVTDATWRFSDGQLIESPCGWNVLKGKDYSSRLLFQGYSFKAEGKNDRAISCFEPVKTSSPEAMVEINKLNEIIKFKRIKDTDETTLTPEPIIHDNPNDQLNVENFNIEAEKLFRQGEYKAALEKITSYLEIYPNDFEAVLIASKILESMGLITEARDVCFYYYMLNPTNGNVTDRYYYFEELLEKQGEIHQGQKSNEFSFIETSDPIMGNIRKSYKLTERKFTDAGKDRSKLKFLQVHTFYDHVINNLYRKFPGLENKSFNEQIYALLEDGFSAVHLISPYMNESGYEPGLEIANCVHSQLAWLSENGLNVRADGWFYDAVKQQIEAFKPDVLYLSDPITFDSSFIKTLRHQPSIILGWRAAPIPSTTDWSSFDCILSALSATRETALLIGAKSAKNFFPGFPTWIYDEINNIEPVYDVVFCGQWTEMQHKKRNDYLHHLAIKSMTPSESFSLAYYLSGDIGIIPPEVSKFNHGARFGLDMHKALRSGKIAVDARSEMFWVNPATGENIDIAGTETANMRIFETTGSGVFLLTEQFDNVSKFFKPGYEIETFADKSELTDKIKYYLQHDSQRETITRRGFERCMREYSISKRAIELDKIIKSFIIRKPESRDIESLFDKLAPETAGPAELTQKAIDLLNSNENTEALEIFDKLIQSDKKRFELNYGKAVALARLGRKAEAIDALSILLKKSPKHKFAKILLEELQLDKSVPDTTIHDLTLDIEENQKADNEEMLEFIDQAVRALNEG
ncbi:MAG: hypothetical protein QG635_1121, partial [Bacteroidota bacterium]|nr:hypothetical protein [Bacteroidota bacterium]